MNIALSVAVFAIYVLIINGIVITATNTVGATENLKNLSSGTFTTANKPLDSVTTIVNQSNVALTSPANYNVTLSTGVFTFSALVANASANQSQLYNFSYQYQPSTYFTDSINRTVASYVTTFALLGLLVVAALIALRYYRKEE